MEMSFFYIANSEVFESYKESMVSSFFLKQFALSSHFPLFTLFSVFAAPS
jgi:hypothetical protein